MSEKSGNRRSWHYGPKCVAPSHGKHIVSRSLRPNEDDTFITGSSMAVQKFSLASGSTLAATDRVSVTETGLMLIYYRQWLYAMIINI